MSHSCSYRSISAILSNSQIRLTIPDNQRKYKWSTKHCECLMKDILKLVDNNEDSHVCGMITLRVNPLKNEFINEVIDGQQRLTTISLLYSAIYNYSINNKIDNPNIKTILGYYLIDKEANESKLKLRLDDEFIYNLIINNKQKDFENFKKETLVKNYKYFYKVIKNNVSKINDILFAISKLEVVVNKIDINEDMESLFNSLNTKSMVLSEGDKFRNFLYCISKVKDNLTDRKKIISIEENVNGNMDSFTKLIGYFYSKNTESITYDKVSDIFEKRIIEHNDSDVLIDEILSFSEFYKEYLSSESLIFKHFRECETIKHTIIDILSPKYEYIYTFSTDEVNYILKIVNSILIRRWFNGVSQAPFKVSNLIVECIHIYETNNNARFLDIFNDVIKKNAINLNYTDDATFFNDFLTKKIYGNKYCEYILDVLENSDSKERNDIINNNLISIEHIMPQTLTDWWKKHLGDNYDDIKDRLGDTISNLTVTAYNSKYGNKSFDEKKKMPNGYLSSKFRLTRDYVCIFDNFTEKEIMERGEFLFKRAIELFPYIN